MARRDSPRRRGRRSWSHGLVCRGCRIDLLLACNRTDPNVAWRWVDSLAGDEDKGACRRGAEEEFLAAQDLEQRRPDLAARRGWCEGGSRDLLGSGCWY